MSEPSKADSGSSKADSGRREFLATSALVAGAALISSSAATAAIPAARIGTSPLVQPALPFADTALEPVISAKTIGFHYGKHHAGYFATLGKLIAGTPMAGKTLEEIILATAGDATNKKIFNNAAQCCSVDDLDRVAALPHERGEQGAPHRRLDGGEVVSQALIDPTLAAWIY